MKSPLPILILLALVTGCTTMSRTERERYQELKAQGIRATDHETKSPIAAGALNLLPGFGNFYLAIGTEEPAQWLFGGVNLFLWPVSPIWGVPQAAIDAGTINKKELVYYYTYSHTGKRKLSKLKASR